MKFFGHAKCIATRVPENFSTGLKNFSRARKKSPGSWPHCILAPANQKLSGLSPPREVHASGVKFSKRQRELLRECWISLVF
jgi:hypothetical protein